VNITSIGVSRKQIITIILAAVLAAMSVNASAATISRTLATRLAGLADTADAGLVIVAFNTNNGLQESHLNILRNAGVTGGVTFPTLGMVAQPMTAGQVRALGANPAVRSLWSNDRLYYYMHQARAGRRGKASKRRGYDPPQRRNAGFGRGRLFRAGHRLGR
jgi:hypothetical protein